MNLIIQGDRVELHLFNENFITPDYLSWMLSPKVNKYLESKKEYTMNCISKYAQGLIDSDEDLFFAIVTDRHIGNIRLGPIYNTTAFVGILIGDVRYHGQGLAGGAVKLLIDFAFNIMMLQQLKLHVVADNVPAVKLWERNNFKAVSRIGKFIYMELCK